MKIMELSTKEYEVLVKKGLVEEDKKIEKLKLLVYSDLIDMNEDERIEVDKENRNKINEIIDYLMENKQ